MLEKKKIFVDAFNKAADDNIKVNQQKVAKYSDTREKAISLKDPISLSFSSPKVSFSTLGELFAWIYPKDGGTENIPSEFQNEILPIIAGSDSSGKDLYKDLHKTFTAKKKLEQSESVKLIGGEKWFDDFNKSAVIKMSAANQKISDYKNAGDLEEAEHLLYEEQIVNRPSGTITQLYDAFIEAGSQPTEKTGAASSINTAEAPVADIGKTPINETGSSVPKKEISPVNPTEDSAEIKADISKSSGTVISEKLEVPTEEKLAPLDNVININLENAPVKPEASANTEISNTTSTNSIEKNVINSVENVLPASVSKEPEVLLKKTEEPSTISSSTSTINNESAPISSTTNSPITNSSNNTSLGINTSPVTNTNNNTVTDINNSSSINIPKAVTNVASNTSVNQQKINTSGKEENSSNINLSSLNIENTPSNNLVNSVEQKWNDFSKESPAYSNFIKNTTEKPGNLSGSKIEEHIKTNNQLEIIKNSELISPKVAPLSPEKSTAIPSDTNKSPEISVQQISQNKETPVVQAEAAKPSESKNSSDAGEKSNGQMVNVDMSEVANRLARIERLLAGPLEVKIVH